MIDQSIYSLQGNLRLQLIEMYHSANAGHIGCSLSCIDLMIGSLIHHKKEEDSFILSKGHAAASLYVCLNHTGEISNEELNTFYKNGTKLPAHPAANKFSGIPFALGSLGHGFPIAAGIAKANKLKKNTAYSYVLMSDGETNEGTTWEAAHFSVMHKLDNLIVLIDKNGLQGFGNTKDILGDTASEEKWQTLGFEVLSINGHDLEQIINGIDKLKKSKNSKPKVIIGNTVKGKGVSFMENEMKWHYLPLDPRLYQQAINDIKKQYSA
ncbi:MAG: transketolase [Bacteroidetes bacterium]|nr:transketolase [Bacteroidota bacterium]